MIVNKISKTKYDFEEKHEKEQKTLLKIVNENKTLVQKIRLNWTENKLKKTVKIYATPIKGIFCEYGIYGTSLKFADGKKKVFIPNKNFLLIENFWKSETGKFVKWYDYSKIQPQNYH